MATRALEGPERGLLLQQASLLQRTARHDPLDELLVDLCRMIEQAADDVTCTILTVDDGRLQHGAAPGMPAAFTQAVDGEHVGPNQGSCGTAAHLGETVVVADIATDPRWTPWRDLALAHDLRACWSTPVVDDTGTVVATFAAYASEPRTPTRAELDLLAWAAHLTSIVLAQHSADEQRLQLTADLEATNAQLLEANRTKDQFLSLTSHELRTPLTLILGTLETLQRYWYDTDAADRDRLLAVTRRHAQRMQRLVEDLLTMSRASGGVLLPRRESILLGDALAEALGDILPEAHDVHLRCDDDLVVDVDPGQLQQIVANFVLNALRHAGDGPVELAAACHGQHVRIAVRDHGPGVPEAFRTELFEPFQQAGDGVPPSGGVGLGLAVVRVIAEAHGGSVWHEAPVDGGARFVVELPLAAPDVPGAA